jgi:sucrose-6-phosphate hydrolase SacC (GH32 family)
MHLYTSGSVDSVPWYGVHVLPRTISRIDNRLVQEPVDEITKLRGDRRHFENISIREGSRNFLKHTKGDTIEIVAVFHPGNARRFGLKVRASADGQRATIIFYNSSTRFFGAEGNLVDSPYPELGQGPGYLEDTSPEKPVRRNSAESEKWSEDSDGVVKFRIFLDRSLLEIFVNGHTCSGIFNGAITDTHIDLFCEGGSATLQSMDIWEMMPAWPMDEPTR